MSGKPKNGYGRPLDLSSPKTYELLRKTWPKKWTKEAARKMLVELGVYTKTGRLTKNYR